MISALRKMRLTHQLILIITANVAVCLLVVSIVLTLQMNERFKEAAVDRVFLVSSGIAANSTATLVFNDKEAATQALKLTLRDIHQIRESAILDKDGNVFAIFGKNPRIDARLISSRNLFVGNGIQKGEATYAFVDDALLVAYPVKLDGESLGEVRLVSDMSELHEELRNFYILIGGLALLSLTVSALLSSWLQKLITRPIHALIQVMGKVSEEAAYGIRLPEIAKNEVGALITGFNSMLGRIEVEIAQRKVSEQQIHTLAFYDSLTGLPNRRLLTDRLDHAVLSCGRSREFGALLFIDLDHFKTVNDTRGHRIGDLLLIEASRRLLAGVRRADTVARLGGDEFVVLLEQLGHDNEQAVASAREVGTQILATIAEPYHLEGSEYFSSCSIGITTISGDQEIANDYLRRADTAMYEAKRGGRNTIRFFDPAMQRALETNTQLTTALRNALRDDEFRLYYQVQTDDRGQAIGAEALLRWEHPERGLLSPGGFIPVAEENGLIIPIGQWVLEAACAQIKEWQSHETASCLKIAINISARQFRQIDFVGFVETTLERFHVDPSAIKLELTESSVLQNVDDSVAKMNRLRALGVSFSLDDFGTGYSSLSQLRRLPLDQIKIDQSFVRDIATDSSDATIVRAILAMGGTLGLDIIAEGVETEAQKNFLIANGCPAFQGYLFGRPISACDFESMVTLSAQSCPSPEHGRDRN
jgi:diguanylate cyclase (GGDEF)-like protein